RAQLSRAYRNEEPVPIAEARAGIEGTGDRHCRCVKTAAKAYALKREEHTGIKVDVPRKTGFVQNPKRAPRGNLVGLVRIEVQRSVHIRVGHRRRGHVRTHRSLEVVEIADAGTG